MGLFPSARPKDPVSLFSLKEEKILNNTLFLLIFSFLFDLVSPPLILQEDVNEIFPLYCIYFHLLKELESHRRIR